MLMVVYMLYFIVVHVYSKQIVDHHRVLFYENIDKGFDVFVHTEDDTLIRPTTVLSFMHEMEKVRLLVGDKVSVPYNIHHDWLYIDIDYHKTFFSNTFIVYTVTILL